MSQLKISMWMAAGLSDKTAAYFKNKTPENEKILLLASEMACRRLFMKMGDEGKELMLDKTPRGFEFQKKTTVERNGECFPIYEFYVESTTLFDAAARSVFNFLKNDEAPGQPDGFTKFMVALGSISFAGLAAVQRISYAQGDAGFWLLVASAVFTYMGVIPNYANTQRYPGISTFRKDVAIAFSNAIGPAFLKLREQKALKLEAQTAMKPETKQVWAAFFKRKNATKTDLATD